MFARVLAEKPKCEGRQLELMLLGTRTEAQGQGLGRAMLRHIIGFASALGYDAVVLEVAKETPAYHFYLGEGFRVDKEVSLPTATLCFVRRPLSSSLD
jgi:ribosomal protein S18 acetylase RimI-like enzyme